MKKISLPGLEIEVTFEDQALNMGGPPIGSIFVKNKVIATNCIVNNFIFDDSRRLLFFVQFHVITHSYYYFTINFWSENDDSVCEFSQEFDVVYLKQFITPTKLEIYRALHAEFPNTRLVFDLDREEFTEL